MRAEIIQANGIGAVAYEVDPFSINKVELVTLQGPQGQKGDKGDKGDPGNFRLDQLVPTDSASGSVASFSDGGDDLPIKSLQVAITPVQSGSGTPSPSNIRPISGYSGKNVMPNITGTYNGITFTANADGSVHCQGTAIEAIWTYVEQYVDLPYKDIHVGDTVSLWSDTQVAVFGYNGSTSLGSATAKAGNKNTFTIPQNSTRLRLIQYCKSSQTTVGESINTNGKYYLAKENSYTGWTPPFCMTLKRTGKNLIDDSVLYQDGNQVVFGQNTVRTTRGLYLGAGTYTVTVSCSKTAIIYVGTEDAPNGTGIGNTSTSRSFTLNKSQNVAIWAYLSGLLVSDITSVQLELGSTATTYSPYQGNTYTVSLSSAGTVYGGTLDVVKGTLTVDREIVDLGTLSWRSFTTANHERFSATDSSIKGAATNKLANAICSCYALETSNNVYSHTSNNIFGIDTIGQITVYDSSYATAWDASVFTTDMSGKKLVYELATPLTYALSETQINTLLGVNNVWADAGDTSVNFYADTKLYIDKQIALALNA